MRLSNQSLNDNLIFKFYKRSIPSNFQTNGAKRVLLSVRAVLRGEGANGAIAPGRHSFVKVRGLLYLRLICYLWPKFKEGAQISPGR